MKMQEMVIIATLALGIALGTQYFFGPRPSDQPRLETLKSGQSYTAPKIEAIHKPLLTDVNFEISHERAPQFTVVETPLVRATFSDNGAAITNFVIKRVSGDVEREFVLLDIPVQEYEQLAFVVGLNITAPLYFDLIRKTEDQNTVVLEYKGQTDQVVIKKEFVINKNNYAIDLNLTVEPLTTTQEITARVFIPSPFLHESEDKVSALTISEKNSIVITPRSQAITEKYWVMPSLFGTQDRYFVHSLYNDKDNFVQRGYFALAGAHGLTAILEGPAQKTAKAWTLGFYNGPKDADSMAVVDKRLEETLEYGIVAPFAKIMLKILKFLYKYVQNYGVAIILLTLIIRLVMFPFTYKGEQSVRKQAEFDKKMKYLEQKYRDDKERMRLEQAELFKKHGFGGLGGAFLPLLITIPIMMTLSRLLSNAVELHQAPFFGWIQDLSIADPYYVLPMLMGLGLIPAFGAMTGGIRQGVPKFVGALAIGAFMSGFSAGLLLYLVASSWLGIAQTWLVKVFKK